MTSPALDTKLVTITPHDIDAVTTTLLSKDLSGNAEAVSMYEQALRHYFGTSNAIACSSGTAAIHLALLVLGVREGQEVIVPATAPVMTALPILAMHARPVFADVASPTTFALDLADVARKVSSTTTVIISVPMWGYPADGDELVALATRHGIAVVEDAAQAHGTRVDGRYAGTRGVIGAFSTHVRKLVCTGEGGFCLTENDALAERIRAARNLGQPTGSSSFGMSFGLNYKLAAIAAALGASQLARLDDRIAARRVIMNNLRERLSGTPDLAVFPIRPLSEPNGYALLLVADDTSTARRVNIALAEGQITSDPRRYNYQPVYRADVMHSYFREPCRNAEELCQRLISLPCHEAVTCADEDRLVEICSRAARRA